MCVSEHAYLALLGAYELVLHDKVSLFYSFLLPLLQTLAQLLHLPEGL